MADQIEDLCIHEMTTAFCSFCKQKSRAQERRAREQRAKTGDTYTTHPAYAYPTTLANRAGRCDSCDDPYDVGVRIFRADGGWCCSLCADVYETLGVTADGD